MKTISKHISRGLCMLVITIATLSLQAQSINSSLPQIRIEPTRVHININRMAQNPSYIGVISDAMRLPHVVVNAGGGMLMLRPTPQQVSKHLLSQEPCKADAAKDTYIEYLALAILFPKQEVVPPALISKQLKALAKLTVATLPKNILI